MMRLPYRCRKERVAAKLQPRECAVIFGNDTAVGRLSVRCTRASNQGRTRMKSLIVLVAGASSVALGACATTPVAAPAGDRQYSSMIACSGWRNGQCVAWNRLTTEQAAKITVGTVFGPNYAYYVPYTSIPPAMVTQYHLNPTYRYVTADGYTYVVDPTTYAVTQVIAPTP